MSCQSCRYVFVSGKKEEQRYACRRNPPQAHSIVIPRQSVVQPGQMLAQEEHRSMFPTVNADWECGEYASKLEVAH